MDRATGSAPRKLILILLAERCGDGKTECFPSQSDIALKAEISERQVQTHVNALVELGLLTVRREKDQYGKFRHNVYELGITDDEVEYYLRPDKPFLDDRKARVKERSAKIQERPAAGSPLPLDEPPHSSPVHGELQRANGSPASYPTEVERRTQRKSDASANGSALPYNPSGNPSMEPKSLNPSRGGGTASPSPDPSRAPAAGATAPAAVTIELADPSLPALQAAADEPTARVVKLSKARLLKAIAALDGLTSEELGNMCDEFAMSDPSFYRICVLDVRVQFEQQPVEPVQRTFLLRMLQVALTGYVEEDECPSYLLPPSMRADRWVA